MDALLIIHECSRRGVTLEADGENLRVKGSTGALSGELLDTLRLHKADLIAAIGTPSPHSQPPSPHNPACGLGVNPYETRVESPLSPHSPHSPQEIDYSHQHPDRPFTSGTTGVCGVSLYPPECGLGGLETRGGESGQGLASSPHPPACGLSRGLDAEGCGLTDSFEALDGPVRTPRGTWACSDPDAPELDAFVDAVPFEPAPGSTIRWACTSPYCPHEAGWWLSPCGVVNCLDCHPPAFPDLVVARGTAADAPEVLSGRTTTFVRHHGNQDHPSPETPCPR